MITINLGQQRKYKERVTPIGQRYYDLEINGEAVRIILPHRMRTFVLDPTPDAVCGRCGELSQDHGGIDVWDHVFDARPISKE